MRTLSPKRLVQSIILPAILTTLVIPSAFATDPSTEFASEASAALAITAKDATIFWYSTACGGELLPPTVYVRSKPAGGGTQRTIFNPGNCPPDSMFSGTTIAADETDIYWADAHNHIVRQPRSAVPPQLPSVFSPTSALPHQSVELAVDSTFVYWLESNITSGRVVRVPKVAGTGASLSWSVASTSSLSMLRIDPFGVAYVLNAGTLTRLIPAPASLTFTPQAIGTPGAVSRYAVASDRIYWVESDAQHHLVIKSAPIGNPAQVVVNWTINANNGTTVTEMTVDNTNVYWIEKQPNLTSAILRLPRSGGNSVTLTGYGPNGYDEPHQLTAAGGFLFWSILSHPGIRRLPIDSQGMDLTTGAASPQVIQVVQGPANDIPLTAGKPTFVRVFGRIDPATTNQTAVIISPAAILRGTRNGQTLPGSPLSPVTSSVTFTSAPIDPRQTENSLLFQLPESWTHGSVTLQATINPMHTLPESNIANDDTPATTINFQNSPGYCLQIVPIETINGTIRGPSNVMNSFFDRTVSVYPFTNIQVGFDGGPALRRPRLPFGFIQGSDPWRLDNDFELGYLLWNMWWVYSFDTGFACLGAGTTIAGPVANASRTGMAGLGVLYFIMPPGNNAVTSPYSGLAGLAHELGHEFGRGHIGCPPSGPGKPDWIDGSYPYPPCQTDNNTAVAHVGFDTLSQRLLPPATTADLMSYGPPPLWISDYTYRGLLSHLGMRTTLRANVPIRPVGKSQRFLIGGMIEPKPFLGFAFPLDDEQATRIGRRLERTSQPSPEFELRVGDARGENLSHSALRVIEISSEGGTRASMFFNIVNLPTTASRLDVVAINGSTLISRSAGPGVPTVKITSPQKKTKIKSSLTIKWTATDPDNDPLVFSVRYSPNKGHTWHRLGSMISGRSLDINTTDLAGGAETLIQVIASDGIHTATATAGPFEIRRHAPKAFILERDSREPSLHSPVTLLQSDVMSLHGIGYDPEDGPLAPATLNWKLTGQVKAAGNGALFQVEGLPPGRFVATLSAQDSDGNRTHTKAAVTVLPKRIPEISIAPRLDGTCNDNAYARDNDPMRLRTVNAAPAEVRIVRVGKSLYICLSGMPLAKGKSDYAGILIRTVEPSKRRLSSDDLGFFVRRDGTTFTSRGTSANKLVPDAVPLGLAASVSQSDISWSAELRIDLARLGTWDKLVRARVAQYNRQGDPIGGSWPRSARDTAPHTWGLVALGRLAQHVTFPPLSDRRISEKGFTLAATASSGLSVAYAAGGICTVENGHVAVTGTGVCTIVATQPGNEVYTQAPAITRSFQVCNDKTGTRRKRDTCECDGKGSR